MTVHRRPRVRISEGLPHDWLALLSRLKVEVDIHVNLVILAVMISKNGRIVVILCQKW